MKTFVFGMLLVLMKFHISCEKKELYYQSEDLVYVGEYTSGLEGPAVDREGNLFFVNPIKSGSVGKVDTEGNFSLFIEQLPEGSTANGIRFGQDQSMYLADYTGHNVLKVDLQTKKVGVYAHDSLLNQPNDLAICCNDRMFASDPNWKESTGQLWRIENGQFHLLSKDMGTTNGIEVSPDEKTLYVNESVQRSVWAFDLDTLGNISNKKLFYQFDDFGMDGMRCDIEGNLYITRYGKGTVAKLSPEGKLLLEIQMKGKKPSNITFGGKDGKTAYVTLQDRGYIETFRVEKAGNSFVK
ncbi:MAG: SMP-30/gluconolactonase/LRE family protein [Bacteroidota bacterium]|nr:SMP-30/gluconolactonase/LRE family protein [Bacteroidota bacterium]MEC8397630.1 SMP-30/gluconolactonase/LRE family protein [Bacteroidota bacterium]MEC9135738.1 SMP-30/gluconolactonase/LRE family protein [Bacteroidota bacterium]